MFAWFSFGDFISSITFIIHVNMFYGNVPILHVKYKKYGTLSFAIWVFPLLSFHCLIPLLQLSNDLFRYVSEKGRGKKQVDSAQKKMTDMFPCKKSSPKTPAKPRWAQKATSANGVTNGRSDLSPQLTNRQLMKKELFSTPVSTSTSNPFVTPAKEDDVFTPIASTSQPSRQSRSKEVQSPSSFVKRKGSWSSSTDRSRSSSRSRSGTTPTHSRTRSRSRSSTPGRSRSEKRTPNCSRSFLQTEFAQKVIKIDKRTKFQKRSDKNGNWPKMACKKRLFPESTSRDVKKRLNFGQGDSDMLSDSIEVHFAPLPPSDDEEHEAPQNSDQVLGRRRRESSPMPPSSFYGTPRTSRANSRANSPPTVATPSKRQKYAAPKEENGTDKEVIVIEDSPCKKEEPKSTDLAPSSDSSAHSSSSKSLKKKTPASGKGMKTQSRKRLLMGEENTPSVKTYFSVRQRSGKK